MNDCQIKNTAIGWSHVNENVTFKSFLKDAHFCDHLKGLLTSILV